MNPVDRAEQMIARKGRVHLIGVGGIGMAGVAFLLKERGCLVSGCDLSSNRQTKWLEANGIDVRCGHDAAHIDSSLDWVVRSTAIPSDHPEVIEAQEIAIPVLRRGEVLPALLRGRTSIAVSGTHGKTTTTAMIAQILQCGYCIGGEVAGWEGVARDGEVIVVEADESDGTVANYAPDYAVITNIEYDHMEHHASEAAFMSCFSTLIDQTRETVFYAAEDPLSDRVVSSSDHSDRCEPYRPLDASVLVELPGAHNRLNAAAAMAVCQQWKDTAHIESVLSKLQPVRRRFEVVRERNGICIISDYAHHPTEIAALIQTARSRNPKRLLAVFQPHRYTRTQALGTAFPGSFAGVDGLWLLPVYAASEAPLEGGTTQDLMNAFSTEWKNRLHYCDSLESAWTGLKQELREGDMLLVVGAGDIEQIAEWARG